MFVVRHMRLIEKKIRIGVALAFGLCAVVIVVAAIYIAAIVSAPLVVLASLVYPDPRPIWVRVIEDLSDWL